MNHEITTLNFWRDLGNNYERAVSRWFDYRVKLRNVLGRLNEMEEQMQEKQSGLVRGNRQSWFRLMVTSPIASNVVLKCPGRRRRTIKWREQEETEDSYKKLYLAKDEREKRSPLTSFSSASNRFSCRFIKKKIELLGESYWGSELAWNILFGYRVNFSKENI